MGISLKFISSCLASVYRASGKRSVLALNDSKSKGWEKLGMLVWRVVARYKETIRIQDLVQFIGR